MSMEAEITNRNPLDIEPSEMRKIAQRTLGFEGYMARKTLIEHSRDISSRISEDTLVQKVSTKYSNTLYIKAWVKGVPFGAYLMSLAKQPKISSHLAQQRGLLSGGGASRKAKGMSIASVLRDSNGNVVYDEKGEAVINERVFGVSKSQEKVSYTRISKKTGALKTGTKYKYYSTAYDVLTENQRKYYLSGVLRFKNEHGEWRTIREAVIASRHPEYKNWLVNRWQTYGEKNEQLQQKVADKMDSLLQEAFDKHKEEDI